MFKPADGEVRDSFPTVETPAEPAPEATETPAAPAEAPAAPAVPAAPVFGGVIPRPPGTEAPAAEPAPSTPADVSPGADKGTEGLPFDVLIEAGRAGLSAEDVGALQTAEAIRAAIRIKGGIQASTTAATTATSTATAKEPAPAAPALPELKPWDVELPKEFEDAEQFDPKTTAFLKNLVAQVKGRDDAYRAHLSHLATRQPTPEGVDHTAEMMFDMTLNNQLARDDYKPYAERLGIGWQMELSKEEFANRQKVAGVAQELYARQQAQGHSPKLESVIMQAAGIVFPEIASKLGQKAIASKIAARPKIGRPGGGVADNRNSFQRATEAIRDAKRAAGIG